jgi:hypothetical protein
VAVLNEAKKFTRNYLWLLIDETTQPYIILL